MTIETKYNIGDCVWFLFENRAVSAEIIGIETYCMSNGETVPVQEVYLFDNYPKARGVNCYSTKKDLINSL